LVIVGGGVVGAATAFYASRAGLSPLLVEQRPALCTLTTPASTGAFRLQFDNLEELSLVRESVDLFLDFREATRQDEYDLDMRQQGYLFATTDPERATWQRRLVDEQHGWGQTDIEVLDGAEVRQRFPWVGENVVQARFRAGDGFLDPKSLTMGLVAGAGVPVIDLAVVACGPLSGALCRTAGTALPIETVTRQKLVLPYVPEVPRDAPMTIDDDTGAHWRPELEGAYVLFTDPRTPPSPATEDDPTDPSAG
jgi:glycine/D-amino acid oxidase-like deaminating enzyme